MGVTTAPRKGALKALSVDGITAFSALSPTFSTSVKDRDGEPQSTTKVHWQVWEQNTLLKSYHRERNCYRPGKMLGEFCVFSATVTKKGSNVLGKT
eukprot:1463289-Amphidinium_carterae.1